PGVGGKKFDERRSFAYLDRLLKFPLKDDVGDGSLVYSEMFSQFISIVFYGVEIVTGAGCHSGDLAVDHGNMEDIQDEHMLQRFGQLVPVFRKERQMMTEGVDKNFADPLLCGFSQFPSAYDFDHGQPPFPTSVSWIFTIPYKCNIF